MAESQQYAHLPLHHTTRQMQAVLPSRELRSLQAALRLNRRYQLSLMVALFIFSSLLPAVAQEDRLDELVDYGEMAMRDHKYHEATTWFRKALDLTRALPKNDKRKALLLQELYTALEAQKQYSEAYHVLSDLFELNTNACGANSDAVRKTNIQLTGLADTCARDHRYGLALSIDQTCIEKLKTCKPPSNELVLDHLRHIILIYLSIGDTAKTEEVWNQLYAIWTQGDCSASILIKLLHDQAALLYSNPQQSLDVPIKIQLSALAALEPKLRSPEVKNELHDLSWSLTILGDIYWARNQQAQAMDYFKRNVAVGTMTGDTTLTANASYRLAQALKSKGQLSEAEALFKQLLCSYQKTALPAGVTFKKRDIYYALALLLDQQSKQEEAGRYFQALVDDYRRDRSANRSLLAGSLLLQAYNLGAQHKFSQQEIVLKEILKLADSIKDCRSLRSPAQLALAEIYYFQGKHRQAEPLFASVIRAHENEHEFNSELHDALWWGGDNYLHLSYCDKAAASYIRDLSLLKTRAVRNSREEADAFFRLGRSYQQSKKSAQAEAALRTALHLYESNKDVKSQTIATMELLATCYRELNRQKEANSLVTKLNTLKVQNPISNEKR